MFSLGNQNQSVAPTDDGSGHEAGEILRDLENFRSSLDQISWGTPELDCNIFCSATDRQTRPDEKEIKYLLSLKIFDNINIHNAFSLLKEI